MTRTLNVISSVISLWMMAGFANQSVAQNLVAGSAGNAAEQRFAYTNTILVLKFESSKIQLPTTLEGITNNTQLEALKKFLKQRLELFKQIAGNEDAFLFCEIPFTKAMPVARVIVKDRDEASLETLKRSLNLMGIPAPVRQDGYLCFSPTHSLQDAKALAIDGLEANVQRPEITEALHTAASFPIQLAIVPPDYLWTTLRELLPEMPKKLGGGPSSLLTDGLRWAAIGINPSNLTVEVTIQSATNEAATKFAKHLPVLLEQSLAQLPGKGLGDPKLILQDQTNMPVPTIIDSRITYKFEGIQNGAQGLQLLSTIVERIAAPLSKQTRMDRLRQIGLAFHNYESTYKMLPPADKTRNADGSSRLSWRVHILPFLGESALYQQFRLDEAWDSPHNKSLLSKMPDTYKSAPFELFGLMGIQPGFTTIVAPVGEDTIFGQKESVKFSSVTDGLSNTLWLVEVKLEHAIPWTAPQDYAFDLASPAAKLNIGSDGKFLAGMADGSTHFLSGDLPAEKLLNYFRKSDGK